MFFFEFSDRNQRISKTGLIGVVVPLSNDPQRRKMKLWSASATTTPIKLVLTNADIYGL